MDDKAESLERWTVTALLAIFCWIVLSLIVIGMWRFLEWVL